MKDTLIEKIKYKYWEIIPYEYRPSEILYKFKCWAWRRHTTVKPRYLGHGWADRCTMLPHMMFEILSQFLEQECDPGIVDWEASGHMIDVEGKQVNVRQEMQDLYDWWHNVYMKEYDEVNDMLWKEAHKHNPLEKDAKETIVGGMVCYEWDPQFASEEDKEIYHKCISACNKLEQIQNEDLQKKMHRLVNLTYYLWT